MEKVVLPSPGEGPSESYIPKIMIVDDDEAHLQLIKLIMLREGLTCELFLCHGARQALEFLAGTAVDLVLLDVMMPELDGFQVLDRLKDNPDTVNIPVIILTSTQETDYVVRAFAHGAVDYISKPINSAVLAARVAAVLQRKHLENELRLRNKELERISRFKDDLLSICSHDLRAPLAAIEVICSSLDGALRDCSGHGGRELVGKITNQSRLARRLVENLLHYHKIEEGILIPACSFFKVRELLQACAEDEQPLIQAGNIHFQMALPGEDLIAFGDRELLAQAVRNVLGNAIKYTKSTISLVARVSGMDVETGGSLTVTITDDGAGIRDEQMAGVFAKYSKINASEAGSGLGLFIAKAALSLHGGSLTGTSEPHRATTFTLTLPLVFLSGQLPDLSDLAEARVRVISPVEQTADRLEGILLEAGMVNVSTENAEKPSLAALEQGELELVVVDLESSALNFVHLGRIIDRGLPGVQWVFYGSQSDIDTVAKLVKLDCLRLPSPVNPLVFLNLVADALRGKYAKNATGTG